MLQLPLFIMCVFSKDIFKRRCWLLIHGRRSGGHTNVKRVFVRRRFRVRVTHVVLDFDNKNLLKKSTLAFTIIGLRYYDDENERFS